MRAQLSKWGNSLGLRLPRALAEHIGVREGDRVEISADGARLIIEPLRPTYVLSGLLVNMTPEAMREAFDWSEEAGRERMDD